jgi:hypothetical protein
LATTSSLVLHVYKITFLRWLIPLFFLLGCMLVSMSLGLPLLLRLPSEPGVWVSAGIAFFAGLAMPIGSMLMWLFIPAITTLHDPARGVVSLDYRRPLWRSVKVYPIADINDIGLVSMGENAYSLALFLKSGKKVRIDYSSTSNTDRLQEQAARIKAALGLRLSVV